VRGLRQEVLQGLWEQVEPVTGGPARSAAPADSPRADPDQRAVLTLALCGLAIEIACLGLLGLGDLKRQVWELAALFGAAFVAYLGACWVVLGAEPPGSSGPRSTDGQSRAPRPAAGGPRRPAVHPGRTASPHDVLEPLRRLEPYPAGRAWRWALLLGAALLFRATLLVAAPTLSDDLYRYVWEGKVLAAGESPYRYAPTAPELEPLRDAISDGVNNRGVPSPYPPLAQGFGLLAYQWFGASLLGPKVLATLGDLAALGALLLLLRQAGLPPERAAVYAWNPLVLLAFAHSGHNDSWMIALLLAACLLVGAGRLGWSAAALALATLAKVLPLLAVPLFATRWGRRPGPLLVYGAVLAGGYLPLLLLGGGAPGSLFAYTLTWTGNESLFFLLRWGLAALGLPGLTLAKLLSLLAVLLGVGLLAGYPPLRARPLWWRVYCALALALVWASTLNPWYVTALVPFLALALARGRWPFAFRPAASWGWLLFSGTVALAYLTYSTGRWQGWSWVPLAEYGPLYLLVGAAAVAVGAGGLYRLRCRLALGAPAAGRPAAAPLTDRPRRAEGP
jgi:alpha-1,6-mannosyltransferase